MKKKIYIATGNASKLANFKKFISWIDTDITVEKVPDYIEVEENGSTLTENSKLKVIPYVGKYKYPVIANDSGLEFDKKVKEIQDSTKVKRNALGGVSESSLSQEEVSKKMFEFYRNIAKTYGGKILSIMTDVFTVLYPNGTIVQIETSREYELVDREVESYDLFHPLNSLRISPRTGKFMDEMDDEDDRIDKKVIIDALQDLIYIK